MPGASVSTLKFVGVISLGLLTGVSYTTANTTIPSLLFLPSASTANATFQQVQRSTRSQLRILSSVSITSFCLAYLLSPARGGRHPYLLWTGLVVGLSVPLDLFLRKEKLIGASDEEAVLVGEEDGINGEEVQNAMQKFRFSETMRALFSGWAFGMAVLGIWGDGARVERVVQVVAQRGGERW